MKGQSTGKIKLKKTSIKIDKLYVVPFPNCTQHRCCIPPLHGYSYSLRIIFKLLIQVGKLERYNIGAWVARAVLNGPQCKSRSS